MPSLTVPTFLFDTIFTSLSSYCFCARQILQDVLMRNISKEDRGTFSPSVKKFATVHLNVHGLIETVRENVLSPRFLMYGTFNRNIWEFFAKKFWSLI
jgi:hypothetical protein